MSQRSWQIQIIQDNLEEAEEVFEVLLASPEGTVVGSNSKAQVTIRRSGSRTGGKDIFGLALPGRTGQVSNLQHIQGLMPVKPCRLQEVAGRTMVSMRRFSEEKKFHQTFTPNMGLFSWRSCLLALILSSGAVGTASPGPREMLLGTTSELSATQKL